MSDYICKVHQLTLILLLSTLICQGCKTKKQASFGLLNEISNRACLIVQPTAYHCVRFNPDWIVENRIESIIEREYLDGKEGRVHLVTVLEYNTDGYLEFKYSGMGYPKDDSPNKEDIFSRWECETRILDSFVVHGSKIVRFHNEKGKMEKPDTLKMGYSIFNVSKASNYINQENEIVRTYEYDKFKRLISESDSKGKSRFTIVYHSNNKIEIRKFSFWKKQEYSSWLTLDKKGRIIRNFDESNDSTHEFTYDNIGRMIEDEHWFKGKEPNYHTYEYITKDSH